ncbi:MAG: hypothetical protein JRM72_08020 [Nitrososphaerota archaeon]|jgi:hypothetical protein|nr:hypothetical protein [Nitrososphaerota archaeon]
MPGGDWKTIQVKEYMKEKLEALYKQHEHEMLDKDIRSFTGFMQYFLETSVEAQEFILKAADYLEAHRKELEKEGVHSLNDLLFKWMKDDMKDRMEGSV